MTRVRFAPSPTGFLHIGGARTALFNHLFARNSDGILVLRIEDTDTKRSETELTEGIIEGLCWLGIAWDEGPHFQSSRTDRYRAVAERLLKEGAAYYCFCSEVDPGPAPTQAGAEAHACPELARDEAAARAHREPAVIRFRAADDRTILFTDIVYGRVSVESANIEDFALLRSDGTPTYHLSVVVDDVDMRISHVIRGADHLSNTTKQVLLYEAMGESLPNFAHLPLILGPDKTRLSKRHGATSVLEYRNQGFLPLAVRNYLARLGWSPKSEKEFFTDEELVSAFSLDRINKANALFDLRKLEWVNAKVMGSTGISELEPLVKMTMASQGLLEDEVLDLTPEQFRRRVELLQGRARKLTDFGTIGRAFFSDRFEYDAGARQKYLDRSDPDRKSLKNGLRDLVASYTSLDPFDLESTESVLRAIARQHDLKAGKLIGAVRVALTGQSVAPGIFDVIVTLGRETVSARINHLLATLT